MYSDFVLNDLCSQQVGLFQRGAKSGESGRDVRGAPLTIFGLELISGGHGLEWPPLASDVTYGLYFYILSIKSLCCHGSLAINCFHENNQEDIAPE